jgi:hypothetical protein
MQLLQLFIAPLAAAMLTLWAAWLALAAESDADLPRALGGEFSGEMGVGTLSRNLHVAHLTLLVLAGAAAGGAVAWWARGPMGGLIRVVLAVLLVWVLGDLLPRLLAAVAPSCPSPRAGARPPPWRRSARCSGWRRTPMPRRGTGSRPITPATPGRPSATCCSASSRSRTPPSPR